MLGPAAANDLSGMANLQVAAVYQQKFKIEGVKIDAQVMATALAAYVTNSNLAGNAAVAYGFLVDSGGLA